MFMYIEQRDREIFMNAWKLYERSQETSEATTSVGGGEKQRALAIKGGRGRIDFISGGGGVTTTPPLPRGKKGSVYRECQVI